MEKTFIARAEDYPGETWLADTRAIWPSFRDWFLSEGLEARPGVAACRAAIGRFMPEFVPLYDHLCSLLGEEETQKRCLGLYDPAPVFAGCTQGIWLGPEGPALLRNYDFGLDFVSGRIERTRWFGRRCIVMAEGGWGCLDGMNEDGLALSLTFGGRPATGRGFSLILVMRYVLETCQTVSQAAEVLTRIPIFMAQNVLLLDRTGDYALVHLGADREPAVVRALACTNHQEKVVWPEHAAAVATEARQARMLEVLVTAKTLEGAAQAMLSPGLYMTDFHREFGTVYTAVYRPAAGSVDYLWPGKRWNFSFRDFREGSYTHRYGGG
ncbi:MAG: peptidase C45 [Alphaproteobacteria bacterium]|nr:peptidase C45 [Alphaproteobacteria bacterium]MBU0798488.1 peptidase C45 [Alphaproteobacteria bacterium]MBU0888742.1 peptidase C45 [Alphaproteobacteria bacterium]MBU1812539.1 peptidase C45 [Alphaproteobacteria bacterium]